MPQSGRDGDGSFEGGRSGRTQRSASVVEEHRGDGTARAFILPDHQVAGTRDAWPVDPAQVIAGYVLAHRVELGRRAEELAHGGFARPSTMPPDRPSVQVH